MSSSPASPLSSSPSPSLSHLSLHQQQHQQQHQHPHLSTSQHQKRQSASPLALSSPSSSPTDPSLPTSTRTKKDWHQQQQRLPKTRPPVLPLRSVDSVLVSPGPASASAIGKVFSPTAVDSSAPLSASSVTTSFQQPLDRAPNGGAISSASTRLEDIEMDSLTPGGGGGHRRRRSTLTIASGSQPVDGRHHSRQPSQTLRSPSARSPSARSPGDPHDDKISEESERHGRSGVPGSAGKVDGGGGGGGGRGKGGGVESRRGFLDDDEDFDEDLHDDEEMGLTNQDRRRKRAKKRRNTRLDNRVARENISDQERQEADQDVAKKLTINAVLIGLWYFFSLSISLYNKWMFDSDRLNFAFPLFTTSMHMLVQFILASLVLYFVPSLRPGRTPHASDLGRSRHEAEPDRATMTPLFYLTRIGPCGAATGLDIGLGNTSLKFITLTFYTMCKSSALAFVLIFAFIFRLETPTWRLVAVIATMTLGVLMMVAGEVEFRLNGFVLVISAAAFSGFRWSLTQILLLRNPATSNPFSSIFFLAPIMLLTLSIIAFLAEGLFEFIDGFAKLMQEWGPVQAPLILLFPGTIAFLMTASEFALLQRTSVVTLSIAGIFKEVVTISAAALAFDDKLTPVNVSGLFVTIAAIAAYNWIKLAKMRHDAQAEAHTKRHSKGYEQAASSCSSPSGSEDDGEESSGFLSAGPVEDGEEEGGYTSGNGNGRSGDRDRGRGGGDNMVTADGDIIPNPKPAQPEEETRSGRAARSD